MLMFAEVQGSSATETLRFKQALEAEQSLSKAGACGQGGGHSFAHYACVYQTEHN